MQDLGQAAGVLFLFLSALSTACSTQKVVVDSAVCMPLGYWIAFVGKKKGRKKIIPLAFEGQCSKRNKKFTVSSSLWGTGRKL